MVLDSNDNLWAMINVLLKYSPCMKVIQDQKVWRQTGTIDKCLILALIDLEN